MATDWHAYGIKGECPPYARLYPCIALISRGKMFDWWIYKHYKGSFKNNDSLYPANPNRIKIGGSSGMVICKMYYPANPRTAFQQAWRYIHKNATSYWKAFDAGTKTYYNERTTPKAWDGYRRWLSLYLHANYPPEYTIGDLLLQETGDKILTEANEKILIQYYYLLLQDGGFLLQETGSKMIG